MAAFDGMNFSCNDISANVSYHHDALVFSLKSNLSITENFPLK